MNEYVSNAIERLRRADDTARRTSSMRPEEFLEYWNESAGKAKARIDESATSSGDGGTDS